MTWVRVSVSVWVVVTGGAATVVVGAGAVGRVRVTERVPDAPLPQPARAKPAAETAQSAAAFQTRCMA
jgi:hypothetical protein